MKKTPKVSVVMPCYNHGEFLPEAVASVTNIARDDIELVVVDDGSIDERTRKEEDKVSEAGIKVIRQENRGLAAARNAAVRASKGEYIFPLDADDRLRAMRAPWAIQRGKAGRKARRHEASLPVGHTHQLPEDAVRQHL